METTEISVIHNEIDPSAGSDARLHEEPLAIPSGIEVYEIDGPYFFGIATRFEELMMQMGDRPRVRIIRMRRVPFIDSTGLHNLETLCRMSQRAGSTLVLSGVNPGVRATLDLQPARRGEHLPRHPCGARARPGVGRPVRDGEVGRKKVGRKRSKKPCRPHIRSGISRVRPLVHAGFLYEKSLLHVAGIFVLPGQPKRCRTGRQSSGNRVRRV